MAGLMTLTTVFGDVMPVYAEQLEAASVDDLIISEETESDLMYALSESDDQLLTDDEESIMWCDPDLRIVWPVKNVRLSEKDKTAKIFKDGFKF